ncbi:protein SOSEKI 5-like [Rutidosis leptorrhynchoides]|uniref:protein SOSEKI 5-like n=1 Tax=Rutidosis leptorrhynchoides TaxID=125765 RepID=UPI003A9A0D02
MAANSRKSTSEMFISGSRPKKNRNHRVANVTANRDHLIIDNTTTDTSPVVIKPKTPVITVQKVPVLYYLTRNGHIEHPHLIDVPLSSPHGLYLKDVMNTLNNHRGKGMANMFSWSFKRIYKNGYVWHDLSEDDLVEATNNHDYILKGTELLQTTETNNFNNEYCISNTTAAATIIRRRNQSWSSFDNPQEYMVVKCESSRELAANFAADAATQTDEQTKRRSFKHEKQDHVTMISGISSPPSHSSSEVSDGVIGARCVDQTVNDRGRDPTVENQDDASGKTKASQILKQLIACGVSDTISPTTISSTLHNLSSYPALVLKFTEYFNPSNTDIECYCTSIAIICQLPSPKSSLQFIKTVISSIKFSYEDMFDGLVDARKRFRYIQFDNVIWSRDEEDEDIEENDISAFSLIRKKKS